MKRFKNILVACDGDSDHPAALRNALWLAKANEARLTLLDVISDAPSGLFSLLEGVRGDDGAKLDAGDLAAQETDERRARLERLAETTRAEGVPTDTVLRRGPLFLSIIREVLHSDHDLAMKSVSPTPDMFFQSDDMRLFRKCPCPVWVVNEGADAEINSVLAAVEADPDDPTRDALTTMVMQLATSLADRCSAKLHVVNAWRLQAEQALHHPRAKLTKGEIQQIMMRADAEAGRRLDRALEDFPDPRGVRTVHREKGDAADIVPARARDENADVVVMGTVGRTGLSGFFIGNTAETILSRVRCSVLAVKPEGFVSPVPVEDAAEGRL